jgi:hypothetical protein
LIIRLIDCYYLQYGDAISLLTVVGFWPRMRDRALRAPVFLSSLQRKTGRCAPTPSGPSQLRCFLFDPQKYKKSIELGPPTSKAFFFPVDHIQTAEGMKNEVPCPRPAHRSFADPSGNILGSKLCTGATIFFASCYSLLILLVLFFLFNILPILNTHWAEVHK